MFNARTTAVERFIYALYCFFGVFFFYPTYFFHLYVERKHIVSMNFCNEYEFQFITYLAQHSSGKLTLVPNYCLAGGQFQKVNVQISSFILFTLNIESFIYDSKNSSKKSCLI